MNDTSIDYVNQTVSWNHENSGELTVKSAYGILMKNQTINDPIWQRIWKLNVMQRCKTFAWLAIQEKLLTNAERKRKNLCLEDHCHCCLDQILLRTYFMFLGIAKTLNCCGKVLSIGMDRIIFSV